MSSKKGLYVSAGLALALAACSELNPQDYGLTAHNGRPLSMEAHARTEARPQTIGSLSYRAAEGLFHGARARVEPGSPVLVTTLVDIDDLQRSSTLGRVVAEQVANRLVQLGYSVQEVRLSGVLAIREGTGEIVLSRDLHRIGREVDAKAIVVGTYGVGREWVYVNLRMVAAESGQVLSAVDVALPYDADVSRMVVSR